MQHIQETKNKNKQRLSIDRLITYMVKFNNFKFQLTTNNISKLFLLLLLFHFCVSVKLTKVKSIGNRIINYN